MAQNTVSVNSPALQEATKKSTVVWRQDLEALFHHTKDRFPDVVWEVGEGDGIDQELWGHKAVVYARAPPSFQARYFSFRPNPYASSPPPTTSQLSLDLSSSRTPSPADPAPSVAPTNTLLRISTSINPTLFSKELEYLYTGQGFGEAFEFLYDSSESTPNEADAEELRIDKLRKDLVFMWRSRLYSDVRIALTGNFSSSHHENTTAIFSSHRFILVSRCPYFHTALLSWPNKQDQQTLTLPSPPFTPASLHFTLGFIYTGTLIFSHRSYDLDTAFHIMRSSTYLSLPTLYDEIQARIVQEMMHGLFHAFLPFPEYDGLTAGAWGTGGCRCRQCARRAPRVLEFSLADDVKNTLLERGARRALVGLFGEGWCTSEFAALPHKLRDGILRGVGKRTTPQNAFALLSAAEHALARLGAVIDAWAGDVTEMILAARKTIDECVCGQPEACFATAEWNDVMERDGVAFEDAERVEWIMASVLRGVNERNAASLYQTLVSSILLRPHPTETDVPILSPTSHVRIQVEQTRVDLLKWIGKRWLGIRQEGGFDQLEGWALKEISDNLEVPREDLINPRTSASPHKPPRQSTLVRAKESASNNDSISLHSSMRVSIRSRNLPMTSASGRNGSPSARASTATVTTYKTSRMNESTVSLAHGNPLQSNGAEKDGVATKDNPRPDSKLTPALDSIGLPPYSSPTASLIDPGGDRQSPYDDSQSMNESIADDNLYRGTLSLDHNHLPPAPKKTVLKKVAPPSRPPAASKSRSPASPTRPITTSAASVRSSATSVRSSAASVRSVASTIRKSTVTDASKSSKPATIARPTSRVSLASTSSSRPSSRVSEASSTFRTASSSAPRSRQTSTTSAGSTRSAATRARDSTAPKTPLLRTRTMSAGSSKSSLSVRSAVSGGAGTPPAKKRPPVPAVDPSKLSPNVNARRTRTTSGASSVRSGVSVSTVSTAASVAARKAMTSASRKAGTGTGAAGLSPAEQVKEMARARDKEVVKATKQVTRTASSASVSASASSPAPAPAAVEPELESTSSATTIKPPQIEAGLSLEHKKSDSVASTGSNSTLKRRNSSDTITTRLSVITNTASSHASARGVPAPTSISEAKALKENQPLPTLPIAARGATLDIGIPCIISLKRKRFKAYARYIGEVEGEDGPWVGVEVPVHDAWGAAGGGDRDDGERQWNDGTWGGIRYFDIGSASGSEWDYSGDDRAARRRRADWAGGSWGSSMFGAGKSVLKREGDQLSIDHRSKRIRSASPAMSDASGMESRGLFVRPQQVLYVVDALGDDV